ncbi:hypothetical protein PVAND_002456 [Polypedilum vanderplanki]|uniref:RanBP2-type domain-containing protein n=1 Tax=Polypedilum vanderplanki TaxID=319348 RepID=A0A9J6BRF0_POLVA|nr:hypothetical protein PVAND_002456 [Polypedilum vanderplanki]
MTTMYGRDPLEELWKEILDLHWNYLEMEESLKKIDERKKLEGRLREYISIVPHDRKFFLPETEHVLRISIQQMRDFSAFKGAIGFESISQYANNLFTKPWRKEYRVIKMYSGFYQHEIRNNLLDAEKIFIAMGYKLMPNQTLVLEGPICPDQVTNVSRDALTAYVECQIMKQVNSELTSIGLATTWNEIFNFRECHIGDSSQTIKGLTQMLQSHHIHMHGAMRKDPYALALTSPPMHHHYQQQQQAQLCSTHCSIHHPHPYNHQNTLPPPPLPATTNVQQQAPNSYYHHYNQPPPPPPPCSLHYVPQQNCYQHHLPHSKSLDQYDGTKIQQGNGGVNHHRLSLDHNYKQQQQQQQQQQQTHFDYIDVAFNHPYNQPNSRAPLPYNISSNLGHDAGYYPTTDHTRMFSTNEFYQQQLMQQLPTTVNDYHHSHHQKSCNYSDASSPAVHDELISFSNEPVRIKPSSEAKLRSSLKKGTQSTTASDSVDMEQELNELRALKREKSSTPASTSSDVKTRDGIGNYQAWDYVFQNLEKEEKKNHKTPTADEKIAVELENLKVTSNGHGPPRDRSLSHKSNNIKPSSSSSSHHTKTRTKSVSAATSDTQASNHEHKRTSSVMESNQRVQMPKAPELIVGINEWSCRFCTFLNPNTKKICDMCSKSKDFFLDADKNATATCV